MIVIVGGMYRSGSTFVFNIVREILLADGEVATYASNSMPPEADTGEHRHIILKSHAPDDQCTALVRCGVVRCVCSYRRPEDAIASWIEAFGYGLPETIEMMRLWLRWHSHVSQSSLNLAYEDVDKQPRRIIRNLQTWLLGTTRPVEALRLHRKYRKRSVMQDYARLERSAAVEDIGFSYYDRTTFFHRRHVGSLLSRRAVSVLGDAAVARIRTVLAPYVDAQGDYRPGFGDGA